MRGEVADGVVPPVVGQAPPDQERLGHVLVHRQQFDGGHAQARQVRDGGLVAQAGVGPAQLGRDVRVAHGEALDVDLVDDRVRVAVPGPFVVLPAERGVDDQAPLYVPGGVQGARLGRVGLVLAEHLGPERDRSADRLGVRVEQQLGRVAPQAPRRIPRTADPVPVGLPRADTRHERVPHVGVVVPDRDLGFRASLVEQAQRDAVGDGRGDREVRPRDAGLLAGRGAQRERRAGEGGAGVRGDPGGGDGAGRGGLRAGHGCASLLGCACLLTSRATSPTDLTAPWRRKITSAIRPVHPVWWNAPIAAPLSPSKYSLKIRLSCQAGLVCMISVPPKQGRRPSGPLVKIDISRSDRSAATLSRVSCWPDPVGYSIA